MYLLGASGHAKVIIDILESIDEEVEGLFDKNEAIKQLGKYKVEPEESVKPNFALLISIGNNEIRKSLAERFTENAFENAIHPSAILSPKVNIGEGIAIMAGVTINTDTHIKNHVIINTSATVDHDCFIGDFVHIAPNATLCGNITVGEGTLIGAGAVIIPNLNIGKWVTVGAGAVVTQNIPDFATVVGNPARIIKRKP